MLQPMMNIIQKTGVQFFLKKPEIRMPRILFFLCLKRFTIFKIMLRDRQATPNDQNNNIFRLQPYTQHTIITL